MSCAVDAAQRRAGRDVGEPQQLREVEAARLPVVDRLVRLEQVDTADQLLEARDPESRP